MKLITRTNDEVTIVLSEDEFDMIRAALNEAHELLLTEPVEYQTRMGFTSADIKRLRSQFYNARRAK